MIHFLIVFLTESTVLQNQLVLMMALSLSQTLFLVVLPLFLKQLFLTLAIHDTNKKDTYLSGRSVTFCCTAK